MKVLAFPGPRHQPPADATDATPAVPPSAVEAPAPARIGDEPPGRYDRITIRAITVAVVVSIVIHILLLVTPWLQAITKEQNAPLDEVEGPLAVSIAKAPPPSPVPQPKQETAVEKTTPQPRPPQPVKPRPSTQSPRSQIAVKNGNTPPFVVPPPTVAQPPTPEVAATPQPPVASSFEEELAIRQRQRRAQNGGAPDEVVESDNERANRIAKANVQSQMRSATPGRDPEKSGGIFDLRHTGLNDAEFVFNGWNRDFQRGMGKTFDVRAKNGDIHMTVIRQMIEVIREQRPGDFVWYGRARREIVMSARPKDQPELEIFLMKEFYPTDPRSLAH